MKDPLFRQCLNVWCERADADYRHSGLECWLLVIDELYYPVLLQQEQIEHINPAGQWVDLVLQETARGVFVSDITPVHQKNHDNRQILQAAQGSVF